MQRLVDDAVDGGGDAVLFAEANHRAAQGVQFQPLRQVVEHRCAHCRREAFRQGVAALAGVLGKGRASGRNRMGFQDGGRG